MSHYETLGVQPDAAPHEIKAAFRRLAMRHHPDRGGELQRMGRIQCAYDVLSDPVARAHYDVTGEELPPERSVSVAGEAVIAMFQNVVDSGSFGGDLIGRVRDGLAGSLLQLKRELHTTEQHLEKINELENRIVSTVEENYFNNIVAARTELLKNQIDGIKDAIKNNEASLEILESYEDSKPAPDNNLRWSI